MTAERPTYFSLPLSTVEQPTDGEAICNRYWVVTPAYELVFYASDARTAAPQCNPNPRIVRRFLDNRAFPAGCHAELVPVVFMGHAVREAGRLHAEWRKVVNGPCTCRWEGDPPILVPCPARRHPWRAGSPEGPQPPPGLG